MNPQPNKNKKQCELFYNQGTFWLVESGVGTVYFLEGIRGGAGAHYTVDNWIKSKQC